MNRKTILLGVSSGIAAYKTEGLILRLRKNNYDVVVVMTKNATVMINPKIFEKASGKKIITSLFPKKFDYKKVLQKKEVEHIHLADLASLVVIAPATANIIGKIAHGLADDIVTTILLATRAPIIVCPSMNVHMWENPVVQENLHTLEKRGFIIIHPDSGDLACGYTGLGRLASVDTIYQEIQTQFSDINTLKGKTVLVTGGGTMEDLDPVRFITNRSSGKMGKAFAEIAKRMGAEVILIRAKSAVGSSLVKEEMFETSIELSTLIQRHIKKADMVIHTAAVSDFIPQKKFEKKIDSTKSLTINFDPSPKILHQMKDWNPSAIIVGFKAVYKENEKEILSIARNKLNVSNADFIVVNDVGRDGIGFGSDENEVYVVSDKKETKVKKAQKSIIAQKVIQKIIKTLPSKFQT